MKVVLKASFSPTNTNPSEKLKLSIADGKLGDIAVDQSSLDWVEVHGMKMLHIYFGSSETVDAPSSFVLVFDSRILPSSICESLTSSFTILKLRLHTAINRVDFVSWYMLYTYEGNKIHS